MCVWIYLASEEHHELTLTQKDTKAELDMRLNVERKQGQIQFLLFVKTFSD